MNKRSLSHISHVKMFLVINKLNAYEQSYCMVILTEAGWCQVRKIFNLAAATYYQPFNYLAAATMSILFKIGQMSRSSTKYQQKDLITRDIHVKYQSSCTHCSKVISKFNV